ncbi:MAG: glycosyltransferase [Clostridia bacterium]|nr:glycosyltransferase [Clostridia bacterium]
MGISNKNPIISIVIPVCGTEEYFERCIESVLKQSYGNLEIIVVNDGSPGDIADIMKQYTDARIKFIDNKENQGLLRARVCGARKATGDYIAFLDSDDYVSFDFYRVLLNKAVESDADVVIGKTVWEKNKYKYVFNLHESCFHFDALTGDEIKKAYFTQEAQCYSWHTVWNKLYKKSLWDKCLPEYETVDRHIVMTEDIYFSTLLLFNAQKAVTVNTEAYFYCMNENASTDSTKISFKKFTKNIQDISYVFEKAEGYLKASSAEDYVLIGFSNARKHYARMWYNLAITTFTDEEKSEAKEMINSFCKERGKQKVEHDYYFETLQTPWNGGLEYIKQEIAESKKEYISFDIFDTLIKRPLYDPKDIYFFMNLSFSRLTGNSAVFSKIRTEGEELARSYYGNKFGYEDISIFEIYDFISTHYGIDQSITKEMLVLEQKLETEFCSVRNSGKELFDFVKAIGKHAILISDMYLDRNTIETILSENGITGYESFYLSCDQRKLKYNGGLFEYALKELCIGADNIIHIGDTWQSDIEGSKLIGIQNYFLPKAREVFENKIASCNTNYCSEIYQFATSPALNRKKVMEDMGYRCMVATVANYYFDNPYRSFNPQTDFNCDPYFMGFYLVGMHLLGVSKWLCGLCANEKYENLVFLARDGYLPMKVYEKYSGYITHKVSTGYIQTSRKALMPVILKDKLSFYQMPVEYRGHTPNSLLKLLDFASDIKSEVKREYKEALTKEGLDENKSFDTKADLHKFLHIYFRYIYSERKHNESRERVKAYYTAIPDNSLAFDMGYSGRIQAAVCDASGKKVDVAFIHENYTDSTVLKKCGGFDVYNFYEYCPEISGLMREHLLSDLNGSCIGFEENMGNVLPVHEEQNHHYPDRFVIEAIQKGATDFAQSYLDSFGKYTEVLDFSPEIVSLPYEGFLRNPCISDMHIFSASYFEDTVYGGKQEINIEEFALGNLYALGWVPDIREKMEPEAFENDEEKRIIGLINKSSKIKRALVWILLDGSFFKEKIKINYNRLFKKKNK